MYEEISSKSTRDRKRLIDANRLKDDIYTNLERLNIADAVKHTVMQCIDTMPTEGLPTTDKPEVLRKAIEVWGKEPQVDVAIEEMAELTRALLKERRAGESAVRQRKAVHGPNGVIEETADVIIMLTQLCMIFDDKEDVARVIEEKVNRLRKKVMPNGGLSGEV